MGDAGREAARLLFDGIAHNRFVMIGSGETRQNLAYIDDLCEGILLAATRPEAVGETFVLGSEENVSIADLARKIAKIVGGKPWRLRVPAWPVMTAAVTCEAICRPLGVDPPLHRRRVGFFTVNRAFDISKARRLLDYRPRVALTTGCARPPKMVSSRGTALTQGPIPLTTERSPREAERSSPAAQLRTVGGWHGE